ncbi:hypothetical protein CCP3SC15_300018 [Gammaproteobacteria bacterium]
MLDSLKLICFLFIGHSNMCGGCAPTIADTIPHDRIYLWGDEKGFYHGTDNHLFGATSGSPVLPFLKRMAILYPDYQFAGLKGAYSSAMVYQMVPGNEKHDLFFKRLSFARRQATIGGVVAMYGYVEGRNQDLAESFPRDFMRLLKEIRDSVGDPALPCILGRYETNNLRDPELERYRTFEKIIDEKIESLQHEKNIVLAPIRTMPTAYYCEDHHYNGDGYTIFAHDAAALYQINGFDRWFHE